MELYYFSPEMEDNNQQQIEIDQMPVNTVNHTTNGHHHIRHHWESLMKMKTKFNSLNRGI
jgi:hypothetical protein